MLNISREFNLLLCHISKDMIISESISLRKGVNQIKKQNGKYMVKLINSEKDYLEVDIAMGASLLERIFSKNFTSHS